MPTAMRRREKEVRDLAAALDVLACGEVLRLGMIAADGAPYVVPLSFAAVPPAGGEPLRLLVHSAPEGRKIDALRRHPRVAFEVTADAALLPAPKACEFSVAFRCVLGSGRAELVTDPAAKRRALAVIAARYGAPTAPIPEADARRVAVIEIRVDEVSCKVSPPPR